MPLILYEVGGIFCFNKQKRFHWKDLPTIDMIRTGKNINRLRKQANLSVKDLQNIFGFATPQAIYKWQQGAALPSIDNLVVLAAVLQVSLDDILVVNTVIPMQIGA